MATYTQYVQVSLLAGAKYKGEQFSECKSLNFDKFLNGKYELVLETSAIAEQLLRIPPTEECKTLGNFISKNLLKISKIDAESTENRLTELLILGASCLHLFIQNNWHGPPSEKSPLCFCHVQFKDQREEVLSEALQELGIDGAESYEKSRHVIYLYLARLIFLEGRSLCSQLQTWDWWLMRCLTLQQSLLPEKSPTLKATVMEMIENVSKREPLMTDDLLRDIQILFYVEAGYAFQDYFEYRKSADSFKTAKKISGLNISLTGAMGKRTQFQREDKAQLVLQVTREEDQDPADCMFNIPSGVPEVLPLHDDTVLEEVKFTDETVKPTLHLSAIEHALILGLMESYRRSMAQEKLTTEEVLTYLAFLLHHSTNWNVTTMALHLRSKLEKDSRRRAERSMMQLEVLSKMVSSSTSSTEVFVRTPIFFASHVSPSWIVKRDYAALLLSLGLYGEALDIFESLEMWEDVISCYQRLKKIEKAESLIRERLAIKETPTLLCFLGDVTGKIEDYQRAWELSGHRNSRSQRCMGYLYFNMHEFGKAMECFTKSLEINSLQIPLWFTHGCAAMACEQYEVGAKAFRRCVQIDYDNFEAWSNLSTCYVRLKQKVKAHSILQDALKCNYENWRLWENSLIISTDVGEFDDVIRSYHRLLDLKEKWVDVEVLNILTKAVVEKIPGANGIPADQLHGDLLKLFGRITSKVTGEGEIWSNYAKLSMMKIENKEPDVDKALQHLQKAYRCFSQKADWEKDLESCKKVANEAIHLSKLYVKSSAEKNQQIAIQLLSSGKLNLKGALVKVQKQHTDPVTQELSAEVADLCTKMNSSLQDITARIEALKSQ